MTQGAGSGPVGLLDDTGDQVPQAARRLRTVVDHVESVLQGKRAVIELAVTALLADGHMLFEDVPGVGKTTLARALARSTGAKLSRIQFTSDLLPTDILGVTLFDRETGAFDFRPGPIFANFVLDDEINRTTPRTQSALLEAMSEGRVSLDGTTHTLPRPFVVMATQNPLEYHGTYPLPESQLDRFLMRLSIGYPDAAVERRLLIERRRAEPVDSLAPVLATEELLELQALVDRVHVDESLVDYALAVAAATRSTARLRSGVSTRAALALVRAARAHALLQGRAYCLPDDLLRLFGPVLAHRVAVRGPAGDVGVARGEAEAVLAEIVAEQQVPV